METARSKQPAVRHPGAESGSERRLLLAATVSAATTVRRARSTRLRTSATHPPALPPSEDRPASPGAAGPSPSWRCPGGGDEEGDRCALKVTTNTACKLLGCSPERAPAGTVPQRRALPQGLPGLLAPRGGSLWPPSSPPARVHPYTCPTPADRSLSRSHPSSGGCHRIQLSPALYEPAAVPAGTRGGEAGARHPAGGPSTARSPPRALLPQASRP
ncbi:hypothetical protein NN561_008501 [Cricetulus griseus]